MGVVVWGVGVGVGCLGFFVVGLNFEGGLDLGKRNGLRDRTVVSSLQILLLLTIDLSKVVRLAFQQSVYQNLVSPTPLISHQLSS